MARPCTRFFSSTASTLWERSRGDVSWEKGLFEFRVDRTVKPGDKIAEKIVLRVFCHAHGDRKILVLHGYDKGKSPSSRRQQREIETARSRLASWRAAQTEQGKKRRTGRATHVRSSTQAKAVTATRSAMWYKPSTMSSDFSQLIADIEQEAREEGPEAVRELEQFREEFSLASQMIQSRREGKLSQRDLAKLSGVPQSEISRIETGASNPTYATITALLRPLGKRIQLVDNGPITARSGQRRPYSNTKRTGPAKRRPGSARPAARKTAAKKLVAGKAAPR